MPLARSYAWASLAQLARPRALSTTSAIASTSGAAARPQDVTFCDKPVAEAAKTPAPSVTSEASSSPWSLRLSQKLQFARYTLELAEKGGGPGLADHIRRRLMRVAEAELEEGSWVAAGSVPSLPQEAHMAATAYRLGIRSMKRRGEHEAATQMMEDWLRFAATQRMYDPATLVDTKTLQIVVMGVCKQERTSQGSEEYWHDALVRLWDATKAAGIDWTPRMYRNANVVLFSASDLSTERVVAAVELLSKQLTLYWQHRFVTPTAQDSRTRVAEGSPLNRTGPSMQHVAQALSVMRHRLSTVAQLGHTDEADYWSEALRNYLWTMRSISRLFSKAFLPLPFFHDQMIAPLYREVFVAFPQALRYGHLPPLTSQVDRDFVAHYRANVDVFLMATFDRGRVKEVRDANNLRGERRDRLQQMHLSPYLYVACLTYAYRDSPSLTRQTRFVRAILSHLSRAGVPDRRVNLVLFNEAVRLRQRDVEEALLGVLLVQNGIDDSKAASSRPVDDSDLLALIHAGSKRRDAFHSHILLRYIGATGWLRSKPQRGSPSAAQTQDDSGRGSIDAEQVVRFFLPTLPKSPEATHVSFDLSRDAWWLTDSGLCTALLNLALKSGRWPLAQKLWAYIRAYRPAPSVAEATCYLQHFTALVRAAVRVGDTEGFEDRRLGVWEVYEGMREAWRLAEEKGEGTLNADARFWRALYEALGWDRVLRQVRMFVEQQQQRPQQQQQSPQAGIQPFSSTPPPQAPPPPFLHLAISGLPQLAHIAEEMASAAATTKSAALLPPPIVLWFLETFGGEDGRAVCELAQQAREECLAVAAWARGRRIDEQEEDGDEDDIVNSERDAQVVLDSYLESHEGLDRSRRGAQDDAHSDESEVDEALARAFAQREQEAWLRRTSPSTTATRSARVPVEWSRGKGAGWEKLKVKREEKKKAAAAAAAARDEVQQPTHEQAEPERRTARNEG